MNESYMNKGEQDEIWSLAEMVVTAEDTKKLNTKKLVSLSGFFFYTFIRDKISCKIDNM